VTEEILKCKNKIIKKIIEKPQKNFKKPNIKIIIKNRLQILILKMESNSVLNHYYY
jgi:hypothetical protein